MVRLSASHPTVTTHNGTVVRHGTRRRAVAFDPSCPLSETVLRVTASGSEWFTRPAKQPDGRWLITGLYRRPAAAREPGHQEERLGDWLEEHELTRGRTVLLDVVVDDLTYGLRAPGGEAVYEAPKTETAGLMDIARQLEDQTDE